MKAVVLKQLTHPASAVRLIRMGCVNRPFYQIGVSPFLRRPGLPPDEVIGSFDPVANEKNEKLVAVDLDRLAYWMGEGAHLSQGVVTVLGTLFSLVLYLVMSCLFVLLPCL